MSYHEVSIPLEQVTDILAKMGVGETAYLGYMPPNATMIVAPHREGNELVYAYEVPDEPPCEITVSLSSEHTTGEP